VNDGADAFKGFLHMASEKVLRIALFLRKTPGGL
jgi:hypothetical protein